MVEMKTITYNGVTYEIVDEKARTKVNELNEEIVDHKNDTTHITNAERIAWNNKSNFSGNYNDLTNKPTIPSVDGLASETYVDNEINEVKANMNQLQPLFMESMEELEANGDVTKLYILPDNFIYAYQEVAGDVPSFDSGLFDSSNATLNNRLNSSGVLKEDSGSGGVVTDFIPYVHGTNQYLYVKNAYLFITASLPYTKVAFYDSSKTYLGCSECSNNNTSTQPYVTILGDKYQKIELGKLPNTSNASFIRVVLCPNGNTTALTEEDIANIVMKYDEPITDSNVNYTNLFDKTKDGFKEGYRFGSSGTENQDTNALITNYIPYTASQKGLKLHIKGIATSVNGGTTYCRIVPYDASYTQLAPSVCIQLPTTSDAFVQANYDSTVATWELGKMMNGSYNSGFIGTDVAYIRIGGYLAGSIDDVVITIDEDIVESDEPSDPVLGKAWTSTGHAFIPAEYDSQIANLITKTNANATSINTLKNTTSAHAEDIATLNENIETLETKIDKIGTTEIPSYWQTHIDSKIATIKNLHKQYGKDCFSFVLLADTHYGSHLSENTPLLAKKILDECDIKYAIHVGDLQTRGCNKSKEALLTENKAILEMFSPILDRLLMQKGNHDGAYGLLDRDGDGTYNNSGKAPNERESYVHNLTQEEFHEYMYRKVGMIGNVHFDDTGTAYYIDDSSNNVRYIGLNTQYNKYELQADGTQLYPTMWLMNFTQSQLDFLINEALVENTKDKTKFVIFGHVPLTQEIGDREIMQGVLNAFKNKTTYSGTYNGVTDYDKVTVNVDFRNAKGTLVGYFHGHTHVDSLHTSYGFNIIGTRCDAQEENDATLNAEKVLGTVTEQSFDVFTVTSDKIYATKIGAGSDRVITY